MGKYDAWSPFFAQLDGDKRSVGVDELEALIDGGLPESARTYQAWWSGDRGHTVWREFGWNASLDERNARVTFRRTGVPLQSPTTIQRPIGPAPIRSALPNGPRLVLVGCVKSKVHHPARAKDLYDSPLWDKRRSYAEATLMPWAILSAKHGLVDPDTPLEPYDRYLAKETADFRRQWSMQTATQVLGRLTALDLMTVEIHAGSAYVKNGLAQRLAADGISISWPVQGMSIGKQLGWYQ